MLDELLIVHDMHIKMLNMAHKAASFFFFPPSFSAKLLQKSIILWSHSAALRVRVNDSAI